MSLDVVIAGAGVGGLTLAVALRRRGLRVTVLERQAVLGAAGAGLGLGPNAVLALAQLDLARAATDLGATIRASAILDSTGRQLGAEIDVAQISKRIGAPIVALHRARLHDLLSHAVGLNLIRTGVSVVGYKHHADSVTVVCGNGDHIQTSLLVGADGLRSAIRQQLIGDGEPVYAGYTSWRGVTPAGAVPTPPRMTESWGRGERFGMVDIGFGQIYWFAVADAPPGGLDGDVRAELLRRFGGWHTPVREIIDVTPVDQVLRTDISDRPPIKRWHEGRVVLLGDAAHPMTPNLGQGAGQAIEDAVVLDQCLARNADVGAALTAYERRRVSRANAMVRQSRALGSFAQLRNPAAAWMRNTLMRLTPASLAMAQTQKVMRFPDPDQ